MGYKIETIETQLQYDNYKNYIERLNTVLLTRVQATHINDLINSLRIELQIWDNK